MKLLPRKRLPLPGEDGGWVPVSDTATRIVGPDASMYDPKQVAVRAAWTAEYRRAAFPGSSIRIWVYVIWRRGDESPYQLRARYQLAVAMGSRRRPCPCTHEGYFTPWDAAIFRFRDLADAHEAAEKEAGWFARAINNEPQEDYPALFDWDGSLLALLDRCASIVPLVADSPAGGEGR